MTDIIFINREFFKIFNFFFKKLHRKKSIKFVKEKQRTYRNIKKENKKWKTSEKL
jgi:hypothetical protein